MTRTLTRTALAVASTFLACSLVACTSSTGSADQATGSEGTDSFTLPPASQSLLDEAMAVPSDWTPPQSSPPPAKDKSVVAIPCAKAAIVCARAADAFIDGAKALGWQTQLIDPAGDPVKMQSAVRRAMTLGADGIYVGGSVEQLGPQLLEDARKSGMVVINHGGDDEVRGPDGFSATMNNDYGTSAPALAAYVAKDSGGAANVLVINNSEFSAVDHGVTAFESRLAEDCPDCKVVSVLDTAVADMNTNLTTRIKATLQSHPEINYINANIDAIAPQVGDAIQQLGLVGKVKVIGTDGLPQNLDMVKNGIAVASYARPWDLMGWAMADQMNRLFNGEPTVDDARGWQTENYPMQLLDETNLPTDVNEPWNAGIDYAAAYKSLWKVG